MPVRLPDIPLAFMMNNSLAPLWQHLKSYPRRLTLQQNLSLFLAVAFPFQIWTVYQIFKDVEWVTARTNAGDAFGYAAYSLAFALLESAAVFGLLWLVGVFTPAAWKNKQLLAILSWAGWMLAFWAAVGELLASLPTESIDRLVAWLFATGHPPALGLSAGRVRRCPPTGNDCPAYVWLCAQRASQCPFSGRLRTHGSTDHLIDQSLTWLVCWWCSSATSDR